MNIKTVLPTISSFTPLRQICDQAQVKISFWGCRSIHINGYEGSVSIDSLAERVLEIIRERQNYNENELADGRILEARINRLYDEEWEVIQRSNFFTKSIAVISTVPFVAFDLIVIAYSVIFGSRYSYSTHYSWNGETGIGPISRLSAAFRL